MVRLKTFEGTSFVSGPGDDLYACLPCHLLQRTQQLVISVISVTLTMHYTLHYTALPCITPSLSKYPHTQNFEKVKNIIYLLVIFVSQEHFW